LFGSNRILITGGTGSFGKMIVKELVRRNVKEIIIFSRDEKKQYDMRFEFYDQPNLKFVIGDVRNKYSLRRVARNVDIIYHAAALKQVPSCEENVFQAVETNIIGAQNIVDIALEANVKKVIAISTDKAVEPVNVMGMSKAIQERIITNANNFRNGKDTIFACVRYGNVLGSRGSVVPVFKWLITQGRPLTLTDERMTRFILTLDEAIKLVMTATEIMVGGEIFIPEIPSHSIKELAEVFVEGDDVVNKEIRITGIRPGEKIHETLISPTESLRTLKHEDTYIILPQIHIDAIEKNYPDYYNKDIFRYSSENARMLSKQQLRELLRKDSWI
jgi:UDP-N-acetylglucosamine 4,6-dehydratase